MSLLICRIKYFRSSKHILIARLGETFVKHKLIENGFYIYKVNYENKYGEIDIIASKNRKLYFIEVKTRKSKNLKFFNFRDQINDKKIAKLKFLSRRYKREYISILKQRRIIKYKIKLVGVSYYWKDSIIPKFNSWQVSDIN